MNLNPDPKKESEMPGLEMRYFILKPKGNKEHNRASRIAIRHYAKHIRNENPEFAHQLHKWADEEGIEASELTLRELRDQGDED